MNKNKAKKIKQKAITHIVFSFLCIVLLILYILTIFKILRLNLNENLILIIFYSLMAVFLIILFSLQISIIVKFRSLKTELYLIKKRLAITLMFLLPLIGSFFIIRTISLIMKEKEYVENKNGYDYNYNYGKKI